MASAHWRSLWLLRMSQEEPPSPAAATTQLLSCGQLSSMVSLSAGGGADERRRGRGGGGFLVSGPHSADGGRDLRHAHGAGRHQQHRLPALPPPAGDAHARSRRDARASEADAGGTERRRRSGREGEEITHRSKIRERPNFAVSASCHMSPRPYN